MPSLMLMAILLLPGARGDPAAALQARIDAAIVSGTNLVSVPAGEYYFGNRTLLVQDARDLAIMAEGPVTFWFTNTDGGVMLRRCVNVTLSGASKLEPLRIDRSPPPFAQGTVTALLPSAKGGGRMVFTLDADSPDPRAIRPARTTNGPKPNAGVCRTWTKGSRPADGRNNSRGLPVAGLPKGDLGACFDLHTIEQIGPRNFTAPNKGASIGDQFVFYVWKGFTYVIANSSRVITQDVAIHASGDMAVSEMDGEGGHTYRRLKVLARNGRLVAGIADGLHTSDLDHGSIVEDCHLSGLLDDYFNVQTTMLLVLEVDGTTVTLVHPHTSDQAGDFGDDGKPVTDQWYGTTEPLSRVRAGEELIFYDPVDFREMGRVKTMRAASLLSPAVNQSTQLNLRGQALYNALAGAHHRGAYASVHLPLVAGLLRSALD